MPTGCVKAGMPTGCIKDMKATSDVRSARCDLSVVFSRPHKMFRGDDHSTTGCFSRISKLEMSRSGHNRQMGVGTDRCYLFIYLFET